MDVPEPQVAIDFFDDDEFSWHVRLLLVHGGDGKWIWATPDLEVQYGDVSEHRVVSLPRGAPIPQRLVGQLYAFDPITPSELDALRAEAAALAGVLGFKVVAATGGAATPRWVVADASHPRFGEPIDGAVTFNEEKFVHRDAAGLVKIAATPGGDEAWTMVETVATEYHQRWLDEKRSGPGRDLRVCPLVRTGPGGPRRQTVDQAIAAHRPTVESDWPFRSPKAVVELFDGVRASGLGFASYANHYITVSGVAPGGNVAHELRKLFSALRHLSEYDQADCSNLACAELLARRIVQIQRAAKRSPKHPDFSGLEATMHATSLDENGGAVTTKFDEWVASEQKTQAVIMKNQHMWHEERDEELKADASGGGGGSGSGGGQKSGGAAPKGDKKK